MRGEKCVLHMETKCAGHLQFLFSLYLSQFLLKAWSEALARSNALRRSEMLYNSLGKLEVTVLNINTNHFSSTDF